MTANLTSAGPAPEVSVVIPVRNEERVIAEQLHALSRQDFPGRWEVVVGDNGSTDRSREITEAWSDRLPSVTVVDASARSGINAARNAAARRARGELLLFTDADDHATPSWVSSMVEVLNRTDLATGPVQRFDDRGRDLGVNAADGPLVSLDFLPFALGCNLGVRRPAFELVGGFDDEWPYHGGDDIEFSWRAQLAGAVLGFSEDIRVRHRQPATMGRAFRKQLDYGAGSALLSRRFDSLGARRWKRRDVMRDVAALGRDLPWLRSDLGRMAWVTRAGWVTGVAREMIRHRDGPDASGTGGPAREQPGSTDPVGQ